MNEPAQEGSGRQNHGAAGQPAAIGQQNGGDSPLDDLEIQDLGLDDVEIVLLPNRFLHRKAIEFSVGLRTRSAHRWALATIEQAELNAGRIRHPAHQTIHGVDLADQMALAEAADRRIARHHADRIEAQRHQRGFGAGARGSTGRLATSMAAAHHNHIIVIGHFQILDSVEIEGHMSPRGEAVKKTSRRVSRETGCQGRVQRCFT